MYFFFLFQPWRPELGFHCGHCSPAPTDHCQNNVVDPHAAPLVTSCSSSCPRSQSRTSHPIVSHPSLASVLPPPSTESTSAIFSSSKNAATNAVDRQRTDRILPPFLVIESSGFVVRSSILCTIQLSSSAAILHLILLVLLLCQLSSCIQSTFILLSPLQLITRWWLFIYFKFC